MPLGKPGWVDRDLSEAWPQPCERCGEFFPRADLVMQLSYGKLPEGMNYFTHSKAGSALWECTAVDEGNQSRSDSGFWIEIHDDVDGAPTYTRHGTKTYSGDGRFSSAVVADLSGWTNLLFTARVGSEQSCGFGTLSVAMGCISNLLEVPIITWAVTGDRMIWATLPIASLEDPTAVTFYFDVVSEDSDHLWWITDLTLEKDISEPRRMPLLLTTTGAARVNATDSWALGPIIVCGGCKDEPPDEVDDAEPGEALPPEIREELGID